MLDWNELIEECQNCKRCELHKGRKTVVFGRGNIESKLMFIGEGPGEQEDTQGMPFVGPAGKLFDVLLKALQISREDYYITNIVKCRPPGNRVPTEEEVTMCLGYLRNQVSLMKPQIIVCLGATAMKYIIDKESKISQIRGTWIERKGFWIMPTFHPAALLRDESKKIQMWEDIKKVKNQMEIIR